MTETKTFKNPCIFTEDQGWWITHSEGLGNPYGYFNGPEWDMEVTFTKKPLDPKVGDQITTVWGSTRYCVRAVHGEFLWVAKAGYPSESGTLINKNRIAQITNR